MYCLIQFHLFISKSHLRTTKEVSISSLFCILSVVVVVVVVDVVVGVVDVVVGVVVVVVVVVVSILLLPRKGML